MSSRPLRTNAAVPVIESRSRCTLGRICCRTGRRRRAAGEAACGLAPDLAVLVVARFAQGTAAAVMMPASMALLGQAYSDPVRRARAVAVWAMGGAAASCSGPVAGGLLTLMSWRLIFFINMPVVATALVLLARTRRSPAGRRRSTGPGR